MEPASVDDRAEFVAFVRAHQHKLVRRAYLVCGEQQMAEDLVQDALVKLALRWRHLRDGERRVFATGSIATPCRVAAQATGVAAGRPPTRLAGWLRRSTCGWSSTRPRSVTTNNGRCWVCGTRGMTSALR